MREALPLRAVRDDVTEHHGAVVDGALSRRLKALACTAPLHDLDARKAKLDWADAGVYQMAEIALHTIDQVTVAMDFDTGADHEQIVQRLLPFIAAQAPERPPTEHERVARWVLDNLINVGTVERGFRHVYGAVGADGGYERRAFDFKLLVELATPAGEVYLRASDEAINVLVGALDTDVESAQVAAEVKLENLITRGRLADAKLAAEQARYRTVQYGETLRSMLEATRRDVRTVDWEEAIPQLLDSALEHIESRFRAENAILRNITAARDEADEPEHKKRAAELVEIVSDCITRHTQLQARLQAAGATFRAEQDRQEFSGPARRGGMDLFGQLLVPALAVPLRDAVTPVEEYFTAASGTSAPGAATLPSLVSMLLRPAPEREKVVGEIPDPELTPSDQSSGFTDRHWELADELFTRHEAPRRLSELLEEARTVDDELPLLVALRAAHSYGADLATALRQGSGAALLAVDDGTPLRNHRFGGSDLLVAMVALDSGNDGAGEDAEHAMAAGAAALAGPE